MNHPEEITKTTPNYIIKWVFKERQHEPTGLLSSARESLPLLPWKKAMDPTGDAWLPSCVCCLKPW